MDIVDALVSMLFSLIGTTIGSVLGYLILKRIIKGQAKQILGEFTETKTSKEISEMIHKVSEYSKSEDSKRILGKIEKALNDLIGDK